MHRGTMSVLAVSVLVRGFIMSSIHYYGKLQSLANFIYFPTFGT